MSEQQDLTLAESLKKLRELGADGFQWADLPKGAKLLMDEVHDLTTANAEKAQQDIVAALCTFIDETDTPWLPDTVTDPVMKMLIPGIVEALWSTARERLSQAVPSTEGSSPAE